MVKVTVDIHYKDIYHLGNIGRSGVASHGYSQTFAYALDKAITEFVKKYKEESIKENKKKEEMDVYEE